MTDFHYGDTEPEDAWHPDDPVPIQVFNLLRRIDLLDRRSEGTASHLLLTIIGGLVVDYQNRRDGLSERDQVRVDHLVEDYLHVRSRHG